jgi:hypothetical protein
MADSALASDGPVSSRASGKATPPRLIGREKARTFLERLQSRTHIASDPLISLADYIDQIGDRYLRGLDPSSTASGYRGSIRVRVLPALGHLALRSINTAVIDRTIDRWEGDCSPSTLKSTVSALTRVLDEAVRDEIIAANPARTRARRRTRLSTADLAPVLPGHHSVKLADELQFGGAFQARFGCSDEDGDADELEEQHDEYAETDDEVDEEGEGFAPGGGFGEADAEPVGTSSPSTRMCPVLGGRRRR